MTSQKWTMGVRHQQVYVAWSVALVRLEVRNRPCSKLDSAGIVLFRKAQSRMHKRLALRELRHHLHRNPRSAPKSAVRAMSAGARRYETRMRYPFACVMHWLTSSRGAVDPL